MIWCLRIPAVNSHMTLTELQPDWDAQIPFPAGSRIALLFDSPGAFPSQKVESGDETSCTVEASARGCGSIL